MLLLQQKNLLYHIGPTLPESEVFWLSMTGRDWRVMANLKILYKAALEHLLNWDFEVCSHCLRFWLPARWCSGSLYLLCGFRRFLPGQGWRVCSDTSKRPRHTRRWRTLPHTPGNSQNSITFPLNGIGNHATGNEPNTPFSRMDRRCGWRCRAGLSIPTLHWASATKTPAHWEPLAWTPWTSLCQYCCTGWSWCQCGCCLFLERGGWCGDLNHKVKENGKKMEKTTHQSQRTEQNQSTSQCSSHKLWCGGDIK